MIVSENRMENINILLAIRQEFLRNGVKSIFSLHDDIHIVGELDSFETLVDSVKVQLPEILILSTDERNTSVFDYVKTIKASYPEVSVIMMLDNFEDKSIYAALGSCVSACLTTGVYTDELVDCIRRVSNGEYPIFDTLTRPEIAQLIVNDMESFLSNNTINATDAKKTLSNEEMEILRLFAGGYTFDQLVSRDNSSEDDIRQHLNNIYGKIVFNSFCEFQAQPSENPTTYDQILYETTPADAVTIQTIDHYTPEQITEREDNKHDSYGELPPSAWDGFEVLKQELQDTLERLASAESLPVKLPEEEPSKISGSSEEDITAIADTGEPSSGAMTEPHNLKIDEIDVSSGFSVSIPDAEEVYEKPSGIDEDNTGTVKNTNESQSDATMGSQDQTDDGSAIIDLEYDSKSENTPEEILSTKDDSFNNSESETDKDAVKRAEESHTVPQDKLDTTSEVPVKENHREKKQKTKWFKFSLKRDDKTGTNKTHDDNPKRDDKSVPGKLGTLSERVSGLENDNKDSKTTINVDRINTTQKDRRINQEDILSSYKKLGMVIFIQPPVDVKQLEMVESVLNKTDGINIILHKGTAQEHFLIISGQDRSYLLNSLRDIPFVESTLDENEIINLRLAPANKVE